MKTYPLTVMQTVWRRIRKPRKDSLPVVSRISCELPCCEDGIEVSAIRWQYPYTNVVYNVEPVVKVNEQGEVVQGKRKYNYKE